MNTGEIELAAPTETGELGVLQLKRLWSRALAGRAGRSVSHVMEQQFEHRVLDALGVGLEQTQQYLLGVAPTFEEFERWIVATSGGVEPDAVARINAAVLGEPPPVAVRRRIAEIDAMAPVLSTADLAHWDEHGYVIVPDAVPELTRIEAEQAIWQHLGANPADPDSWYVSNDHGIMVQFFQHPAFTANRRSVRLHKAFAQLWGTADLWATTDRVGFNVPERPGWKFRGPNLHWDVSLARPIPFATQGILYLTDTPGEQGAFTCVPGFHRRIDAWLDSQPAGADPREQDLHALGSQPIAGRAGDLVIWDHRLPHGSRPNRGTRPRIVQYIDMYPTRFEERAEWI
ncbi:MAG TPA: phytanoyl-CoA dioxygenase family protein [Opitutus sp.]|nr:phytanoyl-CoA dioxygenase family protein [Opitutus sp.]